MVTPFRPAKNDIEPLALIGGILTSWGSIEKAIEAAVSMIESVAAIGTGKQVIHADLGTMRGFKERKGHLRKLIVAHGAREHVAKLDRIYQVIAKADKTRHGLAHDSPYLVLGDEIGDDRRIGIRSNPLRGHVNDHFSWRTVGEIRAIYAQLFQVPEEIFNVQADVIFYIRRDA